MPRTDTYHDSTHAEVVAGVATTKVYIEPLAETGSRSDANAVLRDLPYPLEILGGEDDYEAVTTGATKTVDLTLGNYAYYTLAADLTVTFPSVLSGKHCAFRLRTIQNGTGGWDVTWPTVTWINTPNPDTTAGAREDYYFESTNGGTTWFGWWLTSGQEVPTVRHTASYTLASGDEFTRQLMNVGSANSLTVPPHSSVPFRPGTWVDVTQWGTGPTTIIEGGGVTVRSPAGLVLPAQYSSARLFQTDVVDEWGLELAGTTTGGGGGGGGTPAVLNQTQTSATTASHSITFSPATAGNLLVVAWRGGDNTNAPSGITAGWSLVKEAYGASTSVGLHIYKKVAAGGETTFAYTTALSEANNIQYWEVTNLTGTADKVPAAVDSTGVTTNVSLHMTTTGTLSTANEWACFVVYAVQGSPTLTTVNQSFVLRNQAAGFSFQFADKLTSATTALDPTLSWTPGSRALGILATFQ